MCDKYPTSLVEETICISDISNILSIFGYLLLSILCNLDSSIFFLYFKYF